MRTKAAAEKLQAAVNDFSVIEELAKERLETVREELEKEVDEIKLRQLQGRAKELSFWTKIGDRVEAILIAP